MAGDGRLSPVVAKPARPLKYRDLGPQPFDHVLQSRIPSQFNQRAMKTAIDLEKRGEGIELFRLRGRRIQPCLDVVEIDLRTHQEVRREPQSGLPQGHGLESGPQIVDLSDIT